MNKPLILVVEDDRSVNNLITTILKTHDYRYLTALNGAEAVLEASSHNPDIVLLDLGLPDTDGVDIIKKIRTWSNMPIIVISARNVGKVLTHTYIMQQIWGSSGASDIASLRVFMATLRKKIDSSVDGPQYIKTHIGVGYRMMKVE